MERLSSHGVSRFWCYFLIVTDPRECVTPRAPTFFSLVLHPVLAPFVAPVVDIDFCFTKSLLGDVPMLPRVTCSFLPLPFCKLLVASPVICTTVLRGPCWGNLLGRLLKVTPQDTLMREPVFGAHIFAYSVVIPFNFSAFITGAVSVTCTSSDNLRFDCYELLSSCRITTPFFYLFHYFWLFSHKCKEGQGCRSQ